MVAQRPAAEPAGRALPHAGIGRPGGGTTGQAAQHDQAHHQASGSQRVRATSGPSDGTEQALETLLALHDHRWQDRSSWGASDATLRRTLLAGLRCGGAVIHEITDGEKVIASEIELLAGMRVAFYQAGRLTDQEFRGSGSALKAEVLRWAVRKGMTEFDLLRGEDSYKDDWSNARREMRRVRTGYGFMGQTRVVGNEHLAGPGPERSTPGIAVSLRRLVASRPHRRTPSVTCATHPWRPLPRVLLPG